MIFYWKTPLDQAQVKEFWGNIKLEELYESAKDKEKSLEKLRGDLQG